MSARRTRAAVLAGLLVLALPACGGGVEGPPDGWRLLEQGRLSVAVMDDWGEVDPETTTGYWLPREGYWDVLLQDTDEFTDTTTGERFIAGTNWGTADPDIQPTGDARETLEYLTVTDPFREGAYPLPDPVEVRTGEVTVWRQDFPVAGNTEGLEYHLWAAADADGTTVVVGLGGRGVTQEMREVIDATLDVRPEGA